MRSLSVAAVRSAARRGSKRPLRVVWRRLPPTLRDRIWPHLLRLRGVAPVSTSLSGESTWPILQLPGQDVAFPPIGSSAQRVVQALTPLAPSARPTIVMLGPIDWSFRLQRPQKLAIELANRGYRIVYVNPTALPSKRVGIDVAVVSENVLCTTLRLPAVSPPYDGTLETGITKMYMIAFDQLRRQFGLLDAWVCPMLPFWTELALQVRQQWGWPVWYDRMDHWSGFERVGPAYGAAEQRLLDQADVVSATASSLQPQTRSGVMVPNACDAGFAALRSRSRAKEGQVIGYVGAIAEWFDVDMVVAAAELPGVTVELFGAVSPEADVSRLRTRSNVVFHGEIPHSSVCDAIDQLDVCLLPFKLRPLTLSTDPVKVYEYLARGKPVVASALPELDRFRAEVRIAHNPTDFAGAVKDALVEADDQTLADRRRTAVVAETWRERAGAIDSMLRWARPTISVIILNWNGADMTIASIRTLLSTTGYPNVEVVCVDNGSRPADRALLEAGCSELPQVKLVLNDENLGFAGGMNCGVRAATGELLVLLNNDAMIGPDGLSTVEAALRDPSVGLLGAVTNWTGNEARIDVNPTTFGTFLRACVTARHEHAGSAADVANIAFFCVALRRAVWERIGELDTRFGIGMFEDDDYCRRVNDAGLRVRIARDWFVYHVGEASFSTLRDDGQYERLFAENKAAFDAKWEQPWKPHTAGSLVLSPHPFGPIPR
jgi:GT2 family glycosyltransferase/glycosyltransferase involved in cell wall biosynthesis